MVDTDERSRVTKVSPVVRGLNLPTLPRVVVVALLVAVVAFLGGFQLEAGLTSPPAPPTAAPTSPAASPQGSAFPLTTGASEFVGTFRPPEMIVGLDGGATCVSHAMSETDPGPRTKPSGIFIRSWTIFCPLEAEKRESLLDQLTNAIGQQTPGYSWSSSSNELGTTVALFPYTQGRFVGTVTLAADAAGAGFEIVITLEERLAQ